MKKLFLIAAATLCLGCSSIPKIQNSEQENIFRNLGIPTKFLNYKKNNFTKKINEFGGRLYGVKDYSNSDGKVEVREIYNITSEDDDGYYGPVKPFRYLFEMNKINGFQDDEVLTDDHEDGLNGNERWYEIKVVRLESNRI
jgi:hypothetical protein